MVAATTALRHKMASAEDLKAVVRAMKASAASAIGQYERSVQALADYALTVEQGLSLCLRQANPNVCWGDVVPASEPQETHAIVFGSDQGLVGSFNTVVVAHALATLGAAPHVQAKVWAVGERAHALLLDAGVRCEGQFEVPSSVEAITRLVTQILLTVPDLDSGLSLRLFHNQPDGRTGYTPVGQALLPLDHLWQQGLAQRAWPAPVVPEVLGGRAEALRGFVREHLFVSLFRASAESLASENASRLAAMQRADQNIAELLQVMHKDFHRLRQSGIGEELFDVIAGFDALDASNANGADAPH